MQHVGRLIVLLFIVFFHFTGIAFSAARLEPLTIGYSNFTGTYAPLWIAVDDHLGAKHGLDLKAIYAGRIRPQQLLATGEVPVVLATATGTITSHILGVKDQVVVATISNKVATSLFSRPEIKTIEELKGKVIATGRPGAFQDALVRYVLRSKFNLIPDKDVRFLPSGEPALSFQALERGAVEGAVMSAPYMFIARKVGMRELANFDKLGVEFPYTSVVVQRQSVAKNPELIDRFLRAIVEGIHVFKTNKPRAMAVLKRYMKAEDEILVETYQASREMIDDAPHPNARAMRSALEMLSLQYPNAKQTDANAIVDTTFMKKIEDSGFIRALYKK
jgi:NitT/TauT family transport system substrate-binding protein